VITETEYKARLQKLVDKLNDSLYYADEEGKKYSKSYIKIWIQAGMRINIWTGCAAGANDIKELQKRMKIANYIYRRYIVNKEQGTRM